MLVIDIQPVQRSHSMSMRGSIRSTVAQALMHALTDSSLLWKAVRVMVRLLKQSYQGDGSAPMSSKRLPLGAFGYPRGSHVATRLSAKLYFCTQCLSANMLLPVNQL